MSKLTELRAISRTPKWQDDDFARRFWSRVRIAGPNECWDWIGARDVRGRGQVHIRWDAKNNVREYASVVAWKLTHGDIPEGQRVLHRCDRPVCCNPSHLFLGTQYENIHDCIRKGRRNAFGRQKLTVADVYQIRAWAALGHTHESIARRFDLARHSVTGIVNRQSWAHLPDPLHAPTEHNAETVQTQQWGEAQP